MNRVIYSTEDFQTGCKENALRIPGRIRLLYDQSEPFAVYVLDLNAGSIPKAFPELADEDIHAACVEVIVIAPKGAKGFFSG